MFTQGLGGRRALTVTHMSAAALRYVPRPDPNPGPRDRIVALAHWHRRYGAGMIYPRLRREVAASSQPSGSPLRRGAVAAPAATPQEGAAGRPRADRWPHWPHEAWSAEFVFDRTAEGRVLKCLTIVECDDRSLGGGACTHWAACP
jgi:hypothetical protein